MTKDSITVMGRVFTFKDGETEMEAHTAAKRYLREQARKAAKRNEPELGPNGMALDPREGPGRRAVRQYDTETGELYPTNPHFDPNAFAKAGKRKGARKGDVTLEPPAARMKVRT